jgi:hypothetical protein
LQPWKIDFSAWKIDFSGWKIDFTGWKIDFTALENRFYSLGKSIFQAGKSIFQPWKIVSHHFNQSARGLTLFIPSFHGLSNGRKYLLAKRVKGRQFYQYQSRIRHFGTVATANRLLPLFTSLFIGFSQCKYLSTLFTCH